MSTLTQILGWLVIIVAAVALLVWAIGYCLERARELLRAYRVEVAESVRRELGRQLQRDHHWFGESRDASLAIRTLSKRLSESHSANWDVNEWREAWRKERAVMESARKEIA